MAITAVPENLTSLLKDCFQVIDDYRIAGGLSDLAFSLYERAFEARLKNRTPEDNRPEHEIVVLKNTLRICWRSGRERESGYPFDRSEFRVAVATSLLHDLRFIPRITEEMIKAAEDRGDHTEADRLLKLKGDQRILHMRGGGEDALRILRAHPLLLTDAEVRQCVGYIGIHDIWKLGWPYPTSSDWLAVCCLEGDALWPLNRDFGVRADLERKGISNPTPDQLRRQAASNLDTQLCHYRANFDFSAEAFQDDETIIRTSEGARILREERDYWNV